MTARDGPVAQSVAAGFWVLRAFTIVLALIWLFGNVHPVPPGMQSVTLRFGRIVRVQQAGLVLALPRPVEQVMLLPSGERQLAQKIEAGTGRIASVEDDVLAPADYPRDAGLVLTADGGIILLDATLYYRISDAAAYYVSQAHIAPALRRAFMAASVAVAARHELDDFLAVRPERATDPAAQAARVAIRGEIVGETNRILRPLGLGVEATRTDVQAILPPAAKIAFNAVLEAAQRADQGFAAARTDAARTRQQADRDRDRILASAHAAASERIEAARTATASLSALEARMDPATRPALLDQLYRDRIATVLHQAGSVSAVDAKSVSRLILPGGR